MKKIISVILSISLLLTCLFTQSVFVASATDTETVVKNEFRILADGNTKDSTSSVTEYFESELSYGDLQGVVNTTTDGEGKVRVLKAGEANVFRIEVDKDATALQLNDLKVDSTDGAFYQYHFYLSDDGESYNIIGSYDGSAGRAYSEYGNNFSWSKVDQGWIRADNNTQLLARAPLNDEGTKKVLYLKISSKGGNCQDPDDINSNAQASYVSFNVQTVVPASSVTVDRVNGDIIDEVRIVADGNTKDSTSAVTEYFESELAVGDLQGVVNDAKNNESKVRLLTAGQANIFKLEIDKDAAAIQINDLKLDSEDGGLYQYHFYISDDGVNFYTIASYDGSYGRATAETGDNFSWSKVDQSYSRDTNNQDITQIAPLNEDGTKKVIYLKVSSKGGIAENEEDIFAGGQVAYTSFTVQSVINKTVDVSNKGIVVCVGDSLTESVNLAYAKDKYPSVLGELLGDDYVVYNQGVGGTRLLSDSVYPYISTAKYKRSLTLSPDIVVIMLGTNDCAELATNQEKYVSDYLELIETYESLESNPKVYVCMSPPRYDNDTFSEMIETYLVPLQEQVVAESGCDVIDIHSVISNSTDVFQSDNLHFNEKGNRVIAETVFNHISKYQIPGKENLEITEYWNGWQGDEYESLASVQADLEGSGAVADPYIITNADQLYAVIYYGGGDFVSKGNAGTCYKLANDLYLNYGYENYATWDTTAPANKWMSNENATNFNGTIDGDGHTIYGYYNDGCYTGLIPYSAGRDSDYSINIKNLHMAYAASVNATYRVAFMYGGTDGGGTGGNQVFVSGCSVKNAEMSGIYGSACNGAIVGMAGRRTVIDKCAVTDVIFNFVDNWGGSHPLSNTNSTYASIGAMVGGPISGGSEDVNAVPVADNCYITVTNSYSVGNILNNARENTSYLVYPIGINQSWGTYYCRAVASNVYTDSTTIPTYSYTSNGVTTNPTLRLTLPGGTAEVLPTDENYPIKTVVAENLIGEGAKTAMPTFNWALYWSTVENGYPIPEDKSEGIVWDGTKTTSIEGLGMEGSGTKADPYVITNGTQLYAAIFSGGNTYSYVIANDIVLNDDYMNYENWGTTAPSNKWTSGSSKDFIGNIDGQGHTIYGFYATGSDSGLIPRINNTPFSELMEIKNINMSHSFIGGANAYDGFIIGSVYWSGGSRRVIIDGCNVRNSKIVGIADNAKVGGIIGAVCNTSTKINNCSVANVEFTASGNNTSYAGWAAMGAMVGSAYTGTTYDCSFVKDGADRVQITNSFAVNCVRTNDSKTIYPIGICSENNNGIQRFYISVAAKNVYTDADVVEDIPSVTTSNTKSGEEITFSLKVASVDDTSTAIDPTSADYPIKQITAEGIKGEAAKTAMPDLNWCHFGTVSGAVPAWADNHTEETVAAVAPTCTATGLTEGKVCSDCGEVLAEQKTVAATDHDWSGEWTDTESGKLLTCKNCEESKFKADITVSGAHLTSEEDVFEVSTVIEIAELTEGTEFDAVKAAIPAEPKRAEVYTITSTTEQNGTATLAITAPTEWNTTDAVICLLTDSGKLRKVETTLENGVATAQISVMGTYALIDLSGATFIGDVDGDSNISASDLVALRNYYLDEITLEEIGGTLDVNRDTFEDARDIVALKKYLANLAQ